MGGTQLASGPALFEETQRFLRNPWAVFSIGAALVGGATVLLVAHALGNPFHPGGLLGLALAAAAAAILALGALRTEVRPDGLYVRFFPFTRQRRFGWDEIRRAEARRYRPLREYGGWGIRWSRAGKAYNVHGNRGVQLELSDGRQLLIGSQRADALAAAIHEARGA